MINFPHHSVRTVLFSLALLAAAQPIRCAEAVAPAPPAPDNSYSKLPRAESNFLVKSARIMGDQAVISRIATTRSTAPEVRAFAEDVVVAYETMATALARLAAAKTVTLDAPGAEATNRKWAEKKMPGFDKDFVNETAAVLQRAISLHQEVVRDGKDPDVTTLAREHMSAITDHLRRAEELQKLLKD